MKKLPLLCAVLALAACQHTSREPAPAPVTEAVPAAADAAPAPKPLFDLPHAQRLLPNGLRIIAIKTPTRRAGRGTAVREATIVASVRGNDKPGGRSGMPLPAEWQSWVGIH